MLKPEALAAVTAFLNAKAEWSRANDALMFWAPRRAVPAFKSPQAMVQYYMVDRGNPYTGDPLYGALDHYLHPERLAHGLEAGPSFIKGMWIDCDDVAGFYHAVSRKSGWQSQVITLVDQGLKGSHVICVGTFEGRAWGADTNGFRWLAGLGEEHLCQVWTDLYRGVGYRYLGAIATPYPW